MTANTISKVDFASVLGPARAALRGYMPGPTTLLLVTGGFHAGASMDLESETYSLGSDVDSDIVLADPGIAPKHVLLKRHRFTVDIEAVGGDVTVDGSLITKGHGRRSRLPVQLQIGDATLRLDGPDKNFAFAIPELSRTTKMLGLAACAVIGIFAISFAANGVTLPASEDQPQQVAALSPTPAPAKSASSQGLVELKARLSEAGLAGLTVDETPGRILVSGLVPGDKSAEWADIHAWFDRNFGTESVLSSEVQTQAAEAMPRLKLRAIWFGDRPYVIASDGARFYEGAFTPDGWTVSEIGDERLLLTKGNAQIALNYR